MTVNDVDQLVERAVTLLKTGDRSNARACLVQALRIDPRHELATLWLSGTSETPLEQRRILKRVLEINPQNRVALRGLAALDRISPIEEASAALEEVQEFDEQVEWSPPEPLSAAQLVLMPTECAQCGALVYGNTSFCWRCHSAVHCCATCEFHAEPRCKDLQHIGDCYALNTCAWWRPKM